MNALELALEWLRPLVRAQKWDYCVIWKLGDDPSRYIEWMDCCCGGGYEITNIKEEIDELTPLCRDSCLKHRVRTKACEALSQLPLFMPLYSGIHTEVVISTQPRWISQADATDSNASNADSVATRALIPVMGGLIELYAIKHIPKDQKTLELILHHYNLSLEREMMSARSCTNSEKSSGSENPECNEILVQKQNGLVSECGIVAQNHTAKVIKRKERENYHSKNLVTERNRRNRIKDGLFTLRSLVPKITKMDRASILGDAVEFIEELQKKEKELLEELRILEEEDCRKSKPSINISLSNSEKGCTSCLPGSSTFFPDIQTEVEVNQIGKKDCYIKLFCKEKKGGFVRLIEAIDSLGLQVVNANVTTFNGAVQNILQVEANKDIQTENLKESLINL